MHAQIAGRLAGPRTKWLVLVFWILVVVVMIGFAAKLNDVQDNQASSWLPDSSESTRALNALDAFQDPDDIPTTLVYSSRSGLDPADLTGIAAAVTKVEHLKGAVRPSAPQGASIPAAALIQESPDGMAAAATISFNFGKNGWKKLPDAADQIRDIAKVPGLELHVAGAGGQASDSAEAFSGLDGRLLFFTIGVVVLILLITYRSPLLWLLPVLSAGTALVAAEGVVYLLAKHAGLVVNGQSQGILTVLVFGAGTDYALLLIARYREELHRHEDRHQAMAVALHRAAPAIVASGLTVILGMLCLLAAEMNATSGLGPVSAVGIAIGLMVMLSLLPAFLVIFGRWIFWPLRPAYDTAEPNESGLWARIGERISVHPRTIWVGTAVVLAVCCLGIVRLDAHGLSTADSYTKEFDSIKGTEVMLAHGLADDSAPIVVVAKAAKAGQVRAAVADLDGVGDPSRPVTKDGIALVEAPLSGDPTSQQAYRAVDRLRAAVHAIPGANALVGGGTAINTDVQHASTRDDKVIIPLVLFVVLLILVVLLRAIVAPLLLIVTVVLSYGAALGISSMLFHHVFGFAGEDPAFPLYTFVFLVALGIDYNIFLMTRVREEAHANETEEASRIALAATGGVITSAGIVLAATFAMLGTMPLVGFAEVGIAVALGVLLDTFVVRSILVTALNIDLGSRIWWPSRLDRG